MKYLAFAAILVCLATGSAQAQNLEVLNLRHRSAVELLPQLQPLVEPGGALTGMGDTLMLRTTPRNAADIRRALQALDRPLRRLMITVRQGGAADDAKLGAGGTVTLSPADSRVGGRFGEQRTTTRQNTAQQVQTVDGGRAFINVGRSFPLPFRQVEVTPTGVIVSGGVVWQDVGTGFHAQPQLAGERVTLDISPHHDVLAGSGAAPGVHTQRLTTTVSGRLGEWIALGGATTTQSNERSGTTSYSNRASQDSRQLWLRVEELP